MMNRLIKTVICLTLLTAPWLLAQEDAGQAGAFLNYGIGGRALGMGRAFTAVADDASALYWNPAGLVGSKRFEMSSMYTNLYYDSQFAHMGLVLPRPLNAPKNPVLNFLLGPSSAIGLGWVGLSMIDFEQRSAYGNYVSDFDMQENALLFGWARELVHDWGILRMGTTVKWASQHFGGVTAEGSMGSANLDRDQTVGADIGLTFQPIHAPLFRIVSLQYLLPLRLGFSVRNAIQPKWRIQGGGEQAFTRLYRAGLSYRLILKDWLPDSWLELRDWLNDCNVLLAYDWEWRDGMRLGRFFGMETRTALPGTEIAVSARWGVNNRTEGASLGLGLDMPFTTSARVRIDYAYGFHPYLKADSRFFLTLNAGRIFDASHFRKKADAPERSLKEKRKALYRILADYPNDEIGYAAQRLIALEDSSRAPRYYDLTGGLGWAEWLFRESKELLATNRMGEAQKKASEAAKEYRPLYMDDARKLQDRELLHYGEALLITGEPEEALAVFSTILEASLQRDYLIGVAQKGIGHFEEASETFASAVRHLRDDADPQGMVTLAFMNWAVSLVALEQYQPAITALTRLLQRETRPLPIDYPRYPMIEDEYIVDDALYLLGLCQVINGDAEEGVDSILMTERYYPGLTHGRLAAQEMQHLLRYQETDDQESLKSLCMALLQDYLADHQWPLP